MSDHPAAEALRDAVRRTVAEVAPEESALTETVLASWRPGRRGRPGAVRGGSVGVGVETATLAQVLLEVGVQALGQIGGIGVVAGSVWTWRRMRRSAPAAGDSSRRVGEPPGSRHPLTARDADRLRAAVRRHASAAGVKPQVQELYADALIGALLPGVADPVDGPGSGEEPDDPSER